MYFVYILRSQKDGKHYTGITNNIEKRLQAHNKGDHATPSTLKRGPFKLVYVEIVNDRKEARRLEKYFKSGAGREIRDEILKQ